MGHDREFLIDSIVRLDLARQAIREFLNSGGKRTKCLHWQPHHSDPIR
jgi:hypothetical protein